MNYLYMNISVVLVIVSTLIIRRIFINKVPHVVFATLWALAMIRVTVPFKFTSDWSIFNLFYHARDMLFREAIIRKHYSLEQIEEMLSTYIALNVLWDIIVCIWGMGVIVIGLHFFRSYRWGKCIINNSVLHSGKDVDSIKKWMKEYNFNFDVEIRKSSEIYVPISFGCIKRGIIIPENFDITNELESKQIVIHESVHLKYQHIVIKLILISIVSFSWFNPFIWVLFKHIKQDMEICCDKNVIARLGVEQRESYARNLLKYAQMECVDSVVYSSFADNFTKERVGAIMRFKKVSGFMAVVSVVLMMSVVNIFGATDDFIIQSEANKSEFNEIKSGQDIEENSYGVVELTTEEVSQYLEKDEKAAHSLNLRDFEYEAPTVGDLPELLGIKFEHGGYTYSGILEITTIDIFDTYCIGYYSGEWFR